MKSALMGLTLFLLVASAWAGRLTDNFDDGNMDEWAIRSPTLTGEESPNNTWRIEDGELIIEAVDSPFFFLIGEDSWGDYTMGLRAKLVKHQPDACCGQMFQLKVRSSHEPTGYNFGLGTFALMPKEVAGVGAFYLQGDLFISHLELSPFEWQLDTWYDLEVTANGNQFQFTVNGEPVLNYVDQTFSTGQAGFGASVFGITAIIDDFFVEGDEIPDSDLSTAVDPKAKLATVWGRVKRIQ